MKKWGFLMVLAACSSQNLVDLYGQWETDKRLTVYPSQVDYGSGNNAWTIAVQDSFVHIVWEHSSPGELYYIRSINSGSSFDPDKQLTTGNSHWPSVAVRDSIVHVAWMDLRDGNEAIYYKRSVNDGETWEADERLTNDPAISRYASVAVCDSIVHVVWMDWQDLEVYYNRSVDNGETWEANEKLSNDPTGSGYPSVAVCDSIVHVVWMDWRDGNQEIYYKRSVDNGMLWYSDERLTNDPVISGYPSIAVRDSIVHVVWMDLRDGNSEIYYNRSVDNGETWGADERLTNDLTNSYNPSVAVCDSIVHIVWRDNRDNNWEIYYNQSVDNGETWGLDERLTNALASSWNPSVACWDCSYGYDVHVVWTDWRHGNHEIYYKRHKCEGTSVEESEELKVKSLELRVFPNPFGQIANIRYQVPIKSRVSLKIYDLGGRKVKTLIDEEKDIGYYKVSWDKEELSTGIYFAKLVAHTSLTTGDFKEIKKLIILK